MYADMLEFKPACAGNNIYLYSAFENGEKTGECRFSIDGMYMDFLSVEASDPLTAEGLIRSSLNFGANRNAYIARVNTENINSQPFIALRFSKKNGLLTAEIPFALQGSCKDCQ